MEEETLQERQSNELEALKAIFTDLFVNCNEHSSEWKPLDVILTVLPLREHSGPSEAHVQLDLHVTACEEYPNKVPKIEIEKHKGLSDKQVAEIKKNLEELAVSKVGEVIIYELVQYVQTVLAEWNKPGFSSFYEEMLSRHEEEKRKEAVRQETEELHKRQLIILEVEGIKKDRQRKKRGKNGKLSEIAEKDDSPSDSPKSKSSLNENPRTKSQDDDRTDNKLLVEFFDRKSGIHHTVPLFHYNSRLVRDFEILDFIGKGAYGDVLKVRNKLDDCLYAIKRIKLTQTNIAVNKKIMREVKLLSSLNHENVVRYYNSWLENLETEEIRRHESKKDAMKKRDKILPDNLNSSFTFPRVLPSFSDDDDDDDEEDDDWIEFRHSGNAETDSPDGVVSFESDFEESVNTFHNQCMYIQMEYCEKSTLRNSIDDNLYKDENRVWRLLREVVEGLAYIHQQGIIHRDLKPVNLFIDSNDHVKIGDFGLATPNKPCNIKLQNGTSRINLSVNTEQELTDPSYTGQVGTALYVAPELNSHAANIHYNQKVDIYSLGIIFFEMCYRPFNTEMERYKVLTNLRLDSIIFPKDFYNDSKMTRQIKLIREFLNHNPSERPSAKEILEKGNLPFTTQLENKKLYETICHTLRNPQSKVYKHLISECFNQTMSEASDITFDESIMHEISWWQYLFIEKMADAARKIFKLHGASFFNTLLLSPNNGVGIRDAGAVPMMGRCGNIVNLTYDLKLAFARYLAQNPHIACLKRYTIDKVFRQRRILGIHPKEILECNFDIVSSGSFCVTVEAEVLSVVCEFLDNFDEILQKNCVICLNHVSLVSAVLFHHHIVSKKHIPVCSVLSKIKMNDPISRTSAAKKLQVFDIPETTVTNLMNALNVKIPPNKLSSYYENLMKKSSASSTYCKQAIAQLEMLVEYLQLLNIKYPIVITPSLMTNFHYYSGIMFQVVWERKQKKHIEKDIIIAAGGRYDNLIAQFREALNITAESKQSVVGVSIYLDKFVSSVPKESLSFPLLDVIVCSLGESNLLTEKLKLMNELWSANIRSTSLCLEENLEVMQDCCEKMKIPHIIFIKESEPGVAGLRSWSKDRYYEKKFSLADVVPHLCRILRQNGLDAGEQANHTRHHYSRAESRSASVSVSDNRPVSMTFLFDEKLNVSCKRRYENQVSNSISNAVRKLSSNVKIEVIVLKVEYELIQALVSAVDLNCNDNNSFNSLYKKFPKHKKILNRIGDHIETLRSSDISPVIIFYGCLDNNFKILV